MLCNKKDKGLQLSLLLFFINTNRKCCQKIIRVKQGKIGQPIKPVNFKLRKKFVIKEYSDNREHSQSEYGFYKGF